jgi:hypothetical protein
MLSHFGALRARNLRLAIIQNNELRIAGPIFTSSDLQSILKEVQPNAAGLAPVSTPAILDLVSSSAAQLGSKWSRVLLIGDFPALDPPTVQYASALLLRTFIRQQVQVSWLPVGRSGNGPMNGVFHIVVSGHFLVVTLHVFVVVRIAKGGFHRSPYFTARSGIVRLVRKSLKPNGKWQPPGQASGGRRWITLKVLNFARFGTG